jgi:AcrR family transcriptional regulator
VAYLSAEERRQSIVDAAIEVIAREGLARATTRRIAEQAQAPLGALHYCFRNKDELIQLVTQRGAEELSAQFAEIDPSLGLEATIRNSIAAMWAWVRPSPGQQLALMELGMWRIRRGGEPEDVYAMWDQFGGKLLRERLAQAAAADGITPAITVDEMVRFINHRFDGLAYEYAASRDEAACQRQTELLADAIVLLAIPPDAKRAKAASRKRTKAAAGA